MRWMVVAMALIVMDESAKLNTAPVTVSEQDPASFSISAAWSICENMPKADIFISAVKYIIDHSYYITPQKV